MQDSKQRQIQRMKGGRQRQIQRMQEGRQMKIQRMQEGRQRQIQRMQEGSWEAGRVIYKVGRQADHVQRMQTGRGRHG